MIKVAHKSMGTNGVFVSPSKSFRLHNKTVSAGRSWRRLKKLDIMQGGIFRGLKKL